MSQEAIKGENTKVDSAFWTTFLTPSVDFSARDEGRNTTVARVDQTTLDRWKKIGKYDIASSKEKESVAFEQNLMGL